MSASNPLLHPPFFLIPGIDPSSPISTQTEQIDQLNTLILQEIDANFARFHQIITARVLPEIKRFAIASEPTREAANFWRNFFEAAAATRLPTSDLSIAATSPSQEAASAYDDHTLTLQANDGYSDSDSFFAPGASSTPLPNRTATVNGHGIANGSYEESWSDSMESPFDRMDRRLQDDLRIGGGVGGGMRGEESGDMPTPSLPSGYDLPGLSESSIGSIGTVGLRISGRHQHSQTRTQALEQVEAGPSDTPKARPLQPSSSINVQQPSNPLDSKWNGITDLRSTPLNAKYKLKPGVGSKFAKPPKLSIADLDRDAELDEDVHLPMSPPVTMTFNLPPRPAAIHFAVKTPLVPGAAWRAKDAEAKLILDDLMEEMGELDSPGMNTPPALKRYSVLPHEMARALHGGGGESGGAGGIKRNLFAPPMEEEPSSLTSDAPRHRRSMANTSYGSDLQTVPGTVIYSNDDSLEDEDLSNDSFDDDATIPAGSVAGSAYSHHSQPPVGSGADGVDLLGGIDDSYMSDISGYPQPAAMQDQIAAVTETGFGGMYRMRETTGGMDAVFGNPNHPHLKGSAAQSGAQFALMKPDEMMTYFGGKLEDAEVGESPLGQRWCDAGGSDIAER